MIDDKKRPSVLDVAASRSMPRIVDFSGGTFYDLFIAKAKELCGKEPCTIDELVAVLTINKIQVNAWLEQAVENGELKKLTKLVRYEMASSKQGALALK